MTGKKEIDKKCGAAPHGPREPFKVRKLKMILLNIEAVY